MTCFSQNRVFKSADSISQTICIQSTLNFSHFFVIRLSDKIRNIVKIGPLMAIFFVKNMNFDFKNTHIYQYSIFLKSDKF